MPVGTVDYRERLRGPGTQDVLGMILRGMAGGSAPSAEPTLDPEGQQALKDMFGGTSTPAPRQLRPDEQAANADRRAREVHRQITAPQSALSPAVKISPRAASMFGIAGNAEMMQAMGMKLGGGRLSKNVEDRRGKQSEAEKLYLKIVQSGVEQAGMSSYEVQVALRERELSVSSLTRNS